MTNVLVTGGAGFVGSHLCEALIQKNFYVTALDNLSSGSSRNLKSIDRNPLFKFVKADCASASIMKKAAKDSDIIFHLAANPEVRLNEDSKGSFHDNVLATHTVLEAIPQSAVGLVVYASSSTVYGEPRTIPTPEDYTPLLPISIYGASKLASEALVSGYARTYGFNAVILRLANVIGQRSNHGVITDFVGKLAKNPDTLEILGDGSQNKSYLHISDLITAVMIAVRDAKGIETYNVGSVDQISVETIAKIVSGAMNLRPGLKFTGGVDGGRGWVGDVKNMLLDVSRLKQRGWVPRYSSYGAVETSTMETLHTSRSTV